MKTNIHKFRHLSTKAKWLNLSINWTLILILGITVLSCSEDNDDEYNVKYVVNSSTIYTGGTLEVEITNENSEKMTIVIDKKVSWETTIGPVNKGFAASLNVVSPSETHGKLELQGEIHTSKNCSTFTLKEFDDSRAPRDSLYISYLIDY